MIEENLGTTAKQLENEQLVTAQLRQELAEAQSTIANGTDSFETV